MADSMLTEVEGGWHAYDQETGLTYFGRTRGESIARLAEARAVFIRVRQRARRHQLEAHMEALGDKRRRLRPTG
jgi:hypothetical protein